MTELAWVCRLAVSAVFVIAAFAKLSDLEGARQAVRDFGVPPALARPLGTLLPGLELVIGVALWVSPATAWAAFAAFVLSGSFLAAVVANLLIGRAPPCRCFGQIDAAPIGSKTVVRLLGLTAAAAVVAFHTSRSGELGMERLFDLVGAEQRGWLSVVVALATGNGALAWVATNLQSKHQRLVRRVDALEHQAFGNNPIRATGRDAQLELGLAIDAAAPAFSLNDLNGNPISLHGLLAQGRSVVALFMDPNCDACTAMLPNVERWQHALRPATDLVIVSRGDVAPNIAKFGSRPIRHVLLERAREVSDAFRCPGTPAAVWISADGRIASSLAMGPDGIRALVQAIRADNNPPAGVPLENPALSMQ